MTALLVVVTIVVGAFGFANMLTGHAYGAKPKLLAELMDALWESDCQ